MRPHLRDVPIPDLPAALRAAGLRKPDFWARRLAVRIHLHGALSWEDIAADPEVGPRVRAALEAAFRMGPQLEHAGARVAEDRTRKDLWRLAGGQIVETVLLRNRKGRTLCVSSQAGCGLGCTFCATGRIGWTKNLTPGEITESVLRAQALAGERVSDVVFMGQGEPLQNYDAVMAACGNLHHQHGMSISHRRITVSTVGLIPQIHRFVADRQPWRLHLSLHAAKQTTRERIMPIARKNPLPELLAAMRSVQEQLERRWLTFQYVAIPDVNMDDEHIDALERELAGLRYIINVIPWNEMGAEYRPPSWAEVKDFTTRLRRLACPVKIRYSGGKQEGMGCGQLSAEQIEVAASGGHLLAPPGIFTA
ncbi:MAG: 23S rRNA (adenine(2503)-C(2))-methyltransferase RlmN [Planctomycetota bacterium]|nr:23S rRNA (adenine(2503)-C(2))-methyltransferase RlmN [Planctomycetota bacterium]